MRQGKRSAGFSGRSVAAIVVSAVLVLALTLFTTHLVYTWVTGAGDEDTLTTSASSTLPMSDTLASGTTGGQGGGTPNTSAPSFRPEDIPGTPDTSTTEPDTTVPEDESTSPEATIPEDETTAPEAETTAAQTTTADTTAPATETTAATSAQTTAPQTTAPTTIAETTVNPNVPVVNAHGIYSKAALMLEVETGVTLFSLDSEKQIYPASLAKMMTAIVTIENHSSLDKNVTISEDMLKGLAEAGASTAGFAIGETVTLNDLLHGLMLPSGADAANAVAVATAGSVDAFVKLMNQKATALGMDKTTFVNTHGLHDDKQVSTCRDLATLLMYALENSSFRRIFTTPSYTTTITEQHPKGITLTNNMSAELAKNPLKSGRVIGNKTGFTTPAGQCLASAAVIGGREYILITVGAGKSGWNTARYNMLDAIELYGRIEP